MENDVVVLYDGEKGEHASEFWEGKRIVEMKKPRPTWFSKNLLQKSTQQNATTTEVKKNEDLSWTVSLFFWSFLGTVINL